TNDQGSGIVCVFRKKAKFIFLEPKPSSKLLLNETPVLPHSLWSFPFFLPIRPGPILPLQQAKMPQNTQDEARLARVSSDLANPPIPHGCFQGSSCHQKESAPNRQTSPDLPFFSF